MTDQDLIAAFKRMRIRPGDCLSHVHRLWSVAANHSECPGVVCMGPAVCRFGLYLHCWLEVGDVAIDLTRRPKTAARADYYRDMGVVATDVRRYTATESATRTTPDAAVTTFWDFDEDAYLHRRDGVWVGTR